MRKRGRAGRQGGREARRQGGREAGRQGGREAGRQGGKEAGRQGGREAGRQGGREAGRQGGREGADLFSIKGSVRPAVVPVSLDVAPPPVLDPPLHHRLSTIAMQVVPPGV